MSIVAEQIIAGQAPELEPVGFRAGWHESPRDVWMPDDSRWPGNQPQDPEESDLNTLSATECEHQRICDTIPGAHVEVSKVVQCFGKGKSRHSQAVWHIRIVSGAVEASAHCPVLTTTLREACDAALADFRAKSLDGAGKATVAA